MASNELTCQELVELVTNYLEEKLPPVERRRFETHLTTCSGCQIYLEQMRQSIRMLGTLTEASISAETQQELLQVFRHWKMKQD